MCVVCCVCVYVCVYVCVCVCMCVCVYVCVCVYLFFSYMANPKDIEDKDEKEQNFRTKIFEEVVRKRKKGLDVSVSDVYLLSFKFNYILRKRFWSH